MAKDSSGFGHKSGIFPQGCWRNSRGSVPVLCRILPIHRGISTYQTPQDLQACHSGEGVVPAFPLCIPLVQYLHPRNKPAACLPCLPHHAPSPALSYPPPSHQFPITRHLLSWEQLPSPQIPQPNLLRKSGFPLPHPHITPPLKKSDLPTLSRSLPAISAGDPPPPSKPHPLWAAPTHLCPSPTPNSTCLGAPRVYKGQQQSTYHYGWTHRPCTTLNHPLGLQGLAGTGTPGRGRGWPLSMVEAYRGRVSVSEEKPASRDSLWRQHSQGTQEWEQGQDPGYKAG